MLASCPMTSSGGRHGPTVGLLHPGAMGSVIGAELRRKRPGSVLWSGEGRSSLTRQRAEDEQLIDAGTLVELAAGCDVVLSVCPPESAEIVAEQVSAAGFDGLYIDANAIAPATARRLDGKFERFVDGGIVGPPPSEPGLTRLYLSGIEAATAAEVFAGTYVETRIVDDRPGSASAVKMCFAAWTKGTSALLLATRALAHAEGVSNSLLGEWETSIPELVGRSRNLAGTVGPKAWRFEGEMREIAGTFEANELPPDFHLAAAEIYHRLAALKDSVQPSIEDVMVLLLDDQGSR